MKLKIGAYPIGSWIQINSQVAFAIAQSLDYALDLDTMCCFLLFHVTRFSPTTEE